MIDYVATDPLDEGATIVGLWCIVESRLFLWWLTFWNTKLYRLVTSHLLMVWLLIFWGGGREGPETCFCLYWLIFCLIYKPLCMSTYICQERFLKILSWNFTNQRACYTQQRRWKRPRKAVMVLMGFDRNSIWIRGRYRCVSICHYRKCIPKSCDKLTRWLTSWRGNRYAATTIIIF